MRFLIKNSWELMESIQRILDDKDVDPFRAPELVQPQKARLARLVIDRLTEAAKDNDKTFAAWLRSSGYHEAANEVDNAAHWRWWQKRVVEDAAKRDLDALSAYADSKRPA